MLKKYFKVFDGKGWSMLIMGCAVVVVTCLIVPMTYNPMMAALMLGVGVELTARFINLATIGSIYRRKDGKNKGIYIKNKEYMDKRFKKVLGVGPMDTEGVS